MDRLRTALIAAVALLLVAGSAPAAPEVAANVGSKSLAFAAREWLDVGLNVNGLTVDRMRLHEPGKVKGLFMRHSDTNRGRIVVTNHTDRLVKPAVAVAVFDDEWRLLAAANTGSRLTPLKPGVTAEIPIHFGGVFRLIERGRTIYVSLEY